MSFKNFIKQLSIQDCITLSYLYLVIIGVINIVIYYSSFNINIFDYISITDILLAPINMLFLNVTRSIIIILTISIITFFISYFFTSFKNNNKLPIIFENIFHPVVLFLLLFSVTFIFLSFNMTEKSKSDVQNTNLKLNTTITFTNEKTKSVYVIATTSLYLFYIEKGETKVNIMPIAGNVKTVKEIE